MPKMPFMNWNQKMRIILCIGYCSDTYPEACIWGFRYILNEKKPLSPSIARKREPKSDQYKRSVIEIN